ncbi:GntR family transcriptional regulator [Saccharopolyspora rhizosphaerae]|uniref:GntR family transcriptional regulator n=1 Tax=Saccharopolyspora rhizosphaerae TaxID=2492662 RepID=A0A426JXN4_9PSEU|nr:GntR family transcriptional regulator [Saccharopolyspora rhizosphaerae]RRO17990.1 GntR family transcriptional regulator [Saccharopolyspora rhizosphaerae]
MPEPAKRPHRRAIYETLRRKVLTLELQPGEALSEKELAAALGVSRTPVREGLILLAEEGLVQVFPQIGSFVSRVDPQRVADAQFLREAVELRALEDVPAEPHPDVLAVLEDNLARQRSPEIDVEDFFALDEEFHRGLLRLSGHERAWPTVVSAKGHLDRARRLGLESSPPQVYARQHVDILDALRAHDLDRARSTMRTHLRAVFTDIEDLRNRKPELFATDSDATPVRKTTTVWQ